MACVTLPHIRGLTESEIPANEVIGWTYMVHPTNHPATVTRRGFSCLRHDALGGPNNLYSYKVANEGLVSVDLVRPWAADNVSREKIPNSFVAVSTTNHREYVCLRTWRLIEQRR